MGTKQEKHLSRSGKVERQPTSENLRFCAELSRFKWQLPWVARLWKKPKPPLRENDGWCRDGVFEAQRHSAKQ